MKKLFLFLALISFLNVSAFAYDEEEIEIELDEENIRASQKLPKEGGGSFLHPNLGSTPDKKAFFIADDPRVSVRNY